MLSRQLAIASGVPQCMYKFEVFSILMVRKALGLDEST